MSRQTLPDPQTDAGGAPFFPSFQKEMNRLIDQFRSGFALPETSQDTAFDAPLFPAIDVVETDEFVEVSAEVPGVRQEDLEASIAGDALILKGQKSSDHEETKDNYHRIERRYGSFRRQVPLGFTPEADAVNAKFSDGVLKLRIEKSETAKAGVRKIEITKS